MFLLLCIVGAISVDALPYYPAYPQFAHYQMDSTTDVATMVTILGPKTGAAQVPAPPASSMSPSVKNQVVDNDTSPTYVRTIPPFIFQQPVPSSPAVQYFSYDANMPFYGNNLIYHLPYQFNYGYPVTIGAFPQYGLVNNAATSRGANKH